MEAGAFEIFSFSIELGFKHLVESSDETRNLAKGSKG
jgi:hypothetical protein